ncbi:MAG: tetratricopeptide repeat protein [Armatimonadota bacterium]|jgi:tetratricopeptide (TPR) repeat protein
MSSDRDGILSRSREQIEAGRHQEAARLLRGWLARSADDAGAWSLLSAALSGTGDWEGAEEAARRALSLRRESARAWTNWAITLRKLERTDEARKALRQALRRDPGYARARAEMERLRAAEPVPDATTRCPECGESVYPTDTQCLQCGADLLAARARMRREAEERARAEAAERRAELLREGERMVAEMRDRGLDDEAVYARLRRSGWAESDLRSILGIDPIVRIIDLPEGRCAFVDSVDRAKQLRAAALERVSELRERRKSINREIGELRSSSRAAEIAARDGREDGIAPDADDLMCREALAALEDSRREVEGLIRAWEEAATAFDAWTGRFY